MHPIFRFFVNDGENEDVLKRLREMYWYAEGYRAKRTAAVLANHPSAPGDGAERQPLVLQQFSGKGRCLFFGFGESWRWAWREDQGLYNSFWIKTMRYLSRNRLGRIDLRLEPQVSDRLSTDRQAGISLAATVAAIRSRSRSGFPMTWRRRRPMRGWRCA